MTKSGAVAASPVKPEYGPTLGQLLAPRWRASSPLIRRVWIVLAIVLVAGAGALVLTLLSPVYSHGGPVPFSFSYRGLHRVAPDPGGYVKVQQRTAAGRLNYSFAVEPLTLPPYSGEPSVEVLLYASGYIDRLRARDPSVVLRGEGKTQINSVPAYDILYTRVLEGREVYGRDVLLLPAGRGRRQGVDIVMLTAKGASRQIVGPMEVASSGVLQAPYRGFTLG